MSADAARRRVTLDDFGDVLTDADLSLLLGFSPQWVTKERCRAKQARGIPDLPAEIPAFPRQRIRHRFRKQDVASWLAGRGSRRRAS
jgi:hypothetical protein